MSDDESPKSTYVDVSQARDVIDTVKTEWVAHVRVVTPTGIRLEEHVFHNEDEALEYAVNRNSPFVPGDVFPRYTHGKLRF